MAKQDDKDAEIERLRAKLRKVASWLDKLAYAAEKSAKDTRFSTLAAILELPYPTRIEPPAQGERLIGADSAEMSHREPGAVKFELT